MKRTVAVGILAALCASASSQNLPSPKRTVFKCEQSGKIVYSDSPCLGAKRVDVEPTRGLNQTSGKQQVGADVRREHQQERMAEALKPLTNETPEQYKARHRRAQLAPGAQARCKRLDQQIADAERKESSAPRDLAEVQKQLLQLRQEQHNLGC